VKIGVIMKKYEEMTNDELIKALKEYDCLQNARALDESPMGFFALKSRQIELEEENRKLREALQSEEIMKEREGKYRKLFEKSLDAIFVAEADSGIIIDCNEKALELMERTREELIGLHQKILHPPEEIIDGFSRTFKENKEGKSQTIECKVITGSGKIKNVEVKAYTFEFKGKKIVQGIFRDITELKKYRENLEELIKERTYELQKSEEFLRESEQIARALMNIPDESICLLDTDFNIIDLNKTFAERFGKNIDELKGINLDKLILPDMLEKRNVFGNKVIKTDKSVRFEDVRNDIWNDHIVNPIFDSCGNVVKLSVSSRDITELKLKEKSLHEAEKNFRLMVETLPIAIHLSTGIDQKCEYLNPTFTKLFGYTMDDIPTGPHWFSLAYPDEKYRRELLEKWIGLISHAMETQSTVGPLEEVEVTCKDGSKKNISWGYITIGEKNYSYGIDLTERKEAEKERNSLKETLNRAHKMEAIGTLAAGIAHDFNNILAIILGFTELSIDCFEEKDTLRENLNQIIIAGNRAKEVISQILSFSDHRQYDKKPLKVSSVLKEAMKLIRASIPSTIEIIQNIETQDDFIFGELGKIHQIILNVCTNSYHAMKKTGGVLEVSLTNIDTNDMVIYPEIEPGPYVRIIVKDTGCGMEKDIIDRIFEPYFTTRNTGEGSGFGLAVVYGIVKSHNGHIKVYSEPGKGTAFHIFLPKINSHITEPEETKELPGGKEHILLVDDEEKLLHVMKKLLNKLGYKVTSSPSSTEALNIFRKEPEVFDLIITDRTMPVMNGIELGQEITKINPHIPIILCTGFGYEVNNEVSHLSGIKKVLNKPVLMAPLSKTIIEVLNKNKNNIN
jgi:PAS domain S-box-containing protein